MSGCSGARTTSLPTLFAFYSGSFAWLGFPEMEASLPEKKRSFSRHLSFGSQPKSTRSVEKYVIRFLGLCSGRDIEAITPEADAYLLHLRSLTDGKWTGELDMLFHEEYALRNEAFEKTIQLSSEVADLLREHGGISICKLVQRLQLKGVFREDQALCKNPVAQSLVFSSLGWLSLLYIPSRRARLNDFRITIQSTKSTIRNSVSSEMVARPLDELLRTFGDLLPRKFRSSVPNGQLYAQEPTINFEVSYMNMAAMRDIAKMKIIWVDSLSAHLEFDTTTLAVSLFKCPSFCQIHQSSDSIFAIMLDQLYQEDDKPSENFSGAQVLDEIMLSYRLLFRDDRRSRRIYQTTERARACLAKTGNRLYVDPCLDDLCGNNISTSFFTFGSPVRDSYDADTYFPIYRDRLRRIQDYMKGIQPNRFLSLWRDRRDLRLWYTIWVVIILGVISLIVSIVSMVLAAAQVSYARMSYELQLQQGTPCPSSSPPPAP